MEKLQKLLILIFALCVLVLPVNAFAAYDPLYATGADTIFADGLWNGFEEVSVDGATYAYHVWYDDGADVRADYYLALFPTYTTETLTYADGSDYQGWGSVTDGSSYNVNYEYYDFEYTDLWYQLYDDGSTYSFVFDYDGYYDNTNTPTGYDYYIDISLLDSGSYFYDYSYWSEDISWSYYLENNLSNASFYEYSSLNDPVNGVQYWNSYWESTATGSYGSYSHTDTGTATKIDYGSYTDWEWDWNASETAYSTFSADYSSLSSSYERRTYSDAGDTRFYSSFWEVTDTPYYYESSSWENDIDGSYQNYYAGVLPEWYSDLTGEYSYAEWSVYYYEDYQPDQYYYELSWEKNLATSAYYIYEDKQYYAGDLKDWEVYQESYYDTESGESYAYVDYYFNDGNYYYDQYQENYSYNNGDYGTYYSLTSSDYAGYSYWWSGTGVSQTYETWYCAETQMTEDWTSYGQFQGRPAGAYGDIYYNYTYTYSAYEMSLADSDEAASTWEIWVRDGASTPTDWSYPYSPVSYEAYSSSLDSDTRDQYTEYYQVTYKTGEPYTYYYPQVSTWYNYSTWENLASGANEVYAEYATGTEVYSVWEDPTYHYSSDYVQSQENGEDLDRTYSTYYIRTNAYQYSYELETLANGAQFQWAYWASYPDSYYVWLKLANPTGTAWSGTGIVDNMMGTYLYYYSAYPNDYFVVENPAYIPDNFYYFD